MRQYPVQATDFVNLFCGRKHPFLWAVFQQENCIKQLQDISVLVITISNYVIGATTKLHTINLHAINVMDSLFENKCMGVLVIGPILVSYYHRAVVSRAL